MAKRNQMGGSGKGMVPKNTPTEAEEHNTRKAKPGVQKNKNRSLPDAEVVRDKPDGKRKGMK